MHPELAGQALIAMITLIGVIVTAVLSYLAQTHARQANDAVNHRHLRTDGSGNNPPKIYDLVIETHQRLNDHRAVLDEHGQAIIEVKQRIEDHDNWEREHRT